MSETSQGPDWWMANDGKWYPPQPPVSAPSTVPPPLPSAPAAGFPSPNYPSAPVAPAAYPPSQGFPSAGYPGAAPTTGYAAMPPGNQMQPAKQGNGAAVASLILGIIALLSGWIFIGAVFGIIGLILGIVGMKKSKVARSGKAMSIIGIILSLIGIASAIVVGVFIKKAVDSVKKAPVGSYAMSGTSCTIANGQANASGDIMNKTSKDAIFIITFTTDAGDVLTATAQTKANASSPWSITKASNGTTCGEPTISTSELLNNILPSS
jgi:hypothetical protein